MWVFNLLILVLFHKVVKLLLCRLLLTIVLIIFVLVFKYVMRCVLFLSEEVHSM